MLTVRNKRRYRGAGDVVEAVTEVTGIKAAIQRRAERAGKPCGCEKRRDALNRMIPFRNSRSDDDGVEKPSGASDD